MAKPKPGRPLKGKIPARELPQLAIRLTPEVSKYWNRFRQDNPYHTQHDLLKELLDNYFLRKRSA